MICEYCKSTFANLISLNTHKKRAKYCLKIQNNIGIINNLNFTCGVCFKNFSDKRSLNNHLNKICMIDSNHESDINQIVITKALFKRAEMHNLIKPFIETIKEHYYLSKQYYIDRQINYNNFITIIRQLCNVNDIKYVSTIVYSKSNYEVEYTIEMPLHMPLHMPYVDDLSGN